MGTGGLPDICTQGPRAEDVYIRQYILYCPLRGAMCGGCAWGVARRGCGRPFWVAGVCAGVAGRGRAGPVPLGRGGGVAGGINPLNNSLIQSFHSFDPNAVWTAFV